MGPAAVVTSTQEDRISFLEDNAIPQLVAQAALYVLTLQCYVTRAICIFIRICMGKITIVSVTYENVAI